MEYNSKANNMLVGSTPLIKGKKTILLAELRSFLRMSRLESKDATDFGKFIETTVKETDGEFLVKLTAVGQTLVEYISKGRMCNTEEYMCTIDVTIDLSELIKQSENNLITNRKIIVIGRFILLTASFMKRKIKRILMNDFPKYLGNRSNFWRYLADIISKYLRDPKVKPDFTTQFLVANACYIELINHCFEMNQHEIIKHDRTFWTAIILHFFGERCKGGGEEKTAVLELNAKTIADIDKALNEKKEKKT